MNQIVVEVKRAKVKVTVRPNMVKQALSDVFSHLSL